MKSKAILLALVLMLLASARAEAVFAPTATVRQDGLMKEAVLILAAEDSAPLPEGSADGRKVVRTRGDGAVSFGEIPYSAPGEYVYRIYQDKNADAGIRYDETVYRLTVTVSYDGQGELRATADITDGSDGGKRGGAVFRNRVSGAVPTIKTGVEDVGAAYFAGGAAILLAAALSVGRLLKRREE